MQKLYRRFSAWKAKLPLQSARLQQIWLVAAATLDWRVLASVVIIIFIWRLLWLYADGIDIVINVDYAGIVLNNG